MFSALRVALAELVSCLSPSLWRRLLFPISNCLSFRPQPQAFVCVCQTGREAEQASDQAPTGMVSTVY